MNDAGERRGPERDEVVEKWLRSYVISVKPRRLSSSERKHLFDAAKAKDAPGRDKFAEAIEIALGSFSAASRLQKDSTPVRVRARIRKLRNGLLAVSRQIDNLDPFSGWLLVEAGRGPEWYVPGAREDEHGNVHVGATPDGEPIEDAKPGFTFGEASEAVCQLADLAAKVLKRTEGYPRHRIADAARLNLAKDVAEALCSHLGVTPTAKKDEVYGSVLRVVLDYAAVDVKYSEDAHHRSGATLRDVRALMRSALEPLAD